MEFIKINEHLFETNDYVTQSSLDDPAIVKLSSLDTLKINIGKLGIHVDDALIKSAILSTSGKTRDIILFLLQNIPSHEKVPVFLKNASLLADYPQESLSPREVERILFGDPKMIHYISDVALTKTLKEFDISIIIPEDRIPNIIRMYPPLLDFYKKWKRFITKEMLELLGYHNRFTIDELIADLGDTVAIAALCHGSVNAVIPSPCSMTRFMYSPFTCIALYNHKQRLYIRKKFIEKKDILEDETTVYLQSHNESEMKSNSSPEVQHLVKMREGMDSPLVSSFDKGQRMINKVFTDSSETLRYDGFAFLLIKGITSTWNLFSLKGRWTTKDILDIIGERRVLFLDYSCNNGTERLGLTKEELDKLGGKLKRTKGMKKRKKSMKKRTRVNI